MITKQLRGEYYDSVCQTFQVKFDHYVYEYFHDFCNTTDDKGTFPSSRQNLSKIHYYSFNDFHAVQRNEHGKIILENRRPKYYQQGESNVPDNDVFGTFGENSPPGIISYSSAEKDWIFSMIIIHVIS